MDDGCIVLEGPHLLEEALRSRWALRHVFAGNTAREKHAALLDRVAAPLTEVSDRALAAAASTETTQGILALAQSPAWRPADLLGTQSLVVILDNIQDPGNAGTIVRSAEAFGATGIVFGSGSVHAANGKFLRATAGSIFRLPFLERQTPGEVWRMAREAGLTLYALAPQAEKRVGEASLSGACGLIVGNEGSGISPAFLTHAAAVRIPAVRVESLNAAVACSLALSEAARQRGGV